MTFNACSDLNLILDLWSWSNCR